KKNNVLVINAKFLTFDETILSTEFNFNSKELEESKNSTLSKRGDAAGELSVHRNLNNLRIVETKDFPECKECSVLLKNLAINYDFRWHVSGYVGRYVTLEIYGGGDSNIDLEFAFTSDLAEWKSDSIKLFQMALGPAVFVPGVLKLGFFFKMEIKVAIALKGKIKLTTGFDVTLSPLQYRWDSRAGSSSQGKVNTLWRHEISHYHGTKIALTAELTPKLELTPFLGFAVAFGGKDVDLGIGFKNVFEFPLILTLFGENCDLKFEVVYKPDLIARTYDTEHTLLRLPKYTLFSKCIWKRMSEPSGPNGPDPGVIDPQPRSVQPWKF
ncbi:hypothetical protein HK099_000374, partial [Clydaea vesicula]